MLSNAHFLAKFRFDTAENEPAKNLQKKCYFCQFCLTQAPNPNADSSTVWRRSSTASFDTRSPSTESEMPLDAMPTRIAKVPTPTMYLRFF